jgi:GNAT superfamily N-acetyltransferase
VWAIPVPGPRCQRGEPAIAGLLVVSPPALNCRGRNVATGGRYVTPVDGRRQAACRLNREIECISRVIVHPLYRGLGLARRLVRHALATAETPHVEALAAMGKLHPLFERAGMSLVGLFRGRSQYYRYYLAVADRRPGPLAAGDWNTPCERAVRPSAHGRGQ